MSENPLEAIERLEKLAAWHRINAERAGADWVWEVRLRTAEDLERRAAKIRGQLSSGSRAVQGARLNFHEAHSPQPIPRPRIHAP